MINSAGYKSTVAKVMAPGFLPATLLSACTPAGAATPSGKAFMAHVA